MSIAIRVHDISYAEVHNHGDLSTVSIVGFDTSEAVLFFDDKHHKARAEAVAAAINATYEDTSE